MIRTASHNSDHVALLHTALGLVTAHPGTRLQSDVPLGLALQPRRELGEILIWFYDTAEHLDWWAAGLTAGACNHLLRSLLPLRACGVMYGVACGCCAWLRAARGALTPARLCLCQSVTPMMHPHISSLRRSFGTSQPRLCAAGKHCGLITS